MTTPVKTSWLVKSILACIGSVGLLELSLGAAPAVVTPAGLPLYFEANQGQADSAAQFVARGQDSQFLISPAGMQINLSKPASGPAQLKMQFLGANPHAQISGDKELAGKINHLAGNDPARWKTGVPTFTKVRVDNLYPGIGLVYYGNHRQLEYDFTIAPGVNPDTIAACFSGADTISISPVGELVLGLGGGEIRQPKPLMYQVVNGARKIISGGYRLTGAKTVGFSIGQYDRHLPLVIDPVLGYSTYFGGNGNDTAWAVTVDTNGFVYIAGQTTSTQFGPGKPMATPGAFQTNFQGGTIAGDVFVAKLDNAGTNLIYLTYLGGSADDAAYGLAVDASGNAYVAGATDSPNFPVKNAIYTNISGTIDKYSHGYLSDAFVAELNPGGSNLIYSTFLGGAASDAAQGIALDSAGNAFVTGFTYSTNFPTSTNAFQKRLGVTNWVYQAYYNANAFVAEINAGGSNLVYASYFGGTNFDEGRGIALDGSGAVYISGYTASVNFPNTNSFQNLLNGTTNANRSFDSFVAKFSPGCSNLVYSTFLGGANNDVGYHLAVDGPGNAYVTGWTVSTNFPDTTTNVPGLYNGLTNNSVFGFSIVTNAFLTQVGWDGTNTAIGYSAVFGGTSFSVDIGYGVALDSAGNAFVVGATSATNFPSTLPANGIGQLIATNAGASDVFVTAFNTNASALLYSVKLGGANNDYGYAIALDSSDNAYIVGQTASANFPTNNARQPVSNGSSDAFLAQIISYPVPPAITTQPTNQSAAVGSTVSFVVVATGTPPLSYQWQLQETNLTWTNLVNGGGISGATNATLAFNNVQTNNSGNYQVIVANYAGSVTSTVAALTVTNVLPVITTQPESQTVGVGSTVSFSVYGIDGTLPEVFQWLRDGTNLVNGTNVSGSVIGGATNNVLTISNAQTNDAGTYWLAITNPAGVVTSSNAVLTVVAFPTILVPPTNQTVGLGATVNFSVTAIGATPLNYQWLMNGTNAVGGHVSSADTNATLTITNTQTSDDGTSFSVIVTNLVGAVTSSPPAVLTVLTAPRFASVINVGGTNFIISGVGGTNGGSFSLLSTTNVALPFTNWTSRGSSFFDSQGKFNFNYSLTNVLPQEFLILQMP